MDYKPTKTVTTKRKPKKANAGITFPRIASVNMGIHVITRLNGIRYKVWYRVDGKKKYVLLPRGISLTEARLRRDNLYRNLKKDYGAKSRKPRDPSLPKPTRTVRLTQNTFLRRIPAHWAVEIRGKTVGTAKFKIDAEAKRDAWLAANPEAIPELKGVQKEWVERRRK